MSDPQIWTVIGVLSAGLFATIGAFVQMMRSEFKAVRAEFGGELRAMRSDMNAKFDLLDKDVQALSRHVFGTAG